MAKAPRHGHVKTRLSAAYDSDRIVELYRCLLEDTLALGRSIPRTSVAVMAPPEDLDDLGVLLPADVTGVAQQGTGLAAALTSVFVRFTASDARRVIAFNSDSPHLPPSVLSDGFEALSVCDLVVGPTDDGGYYLVGATAAHTGLFDPTPIGTRSALASLLANARTRGLTVRLLQKWFDVDVAGDLARLEGVLGRDPAAAPRTSALLRSWSARRDATARHKDPAAR
jgi:glycosyltransferase A (GT-A) superfamily protein (DUF2064 family)